MKLEIEHFIFNNSILNNFLQIFFFIEIWLRSTVPNVPPKMKSQGTVNILLTFLKDFLKVYFNKKSLFMKEGTAIIRMNTLLF